MTYYKIDNTESKGLRLKKEKSLKKIDEYT